MTRRQLRITDWPREDRAAWDKLLAHGGLLHPGGAFAGLRPATRGIYQQGYGHWLAFCRGTGVDLDALPPETRVTDERLLAWIEEMDDLTDTTRHSRLVGLHRVVTTMAPETSQPFLRGLCRHAEWKANRQIRRRKIGRVLPTKNLVTAGLTHLKVVEGERFNDAIRYRDGLMITVLALVPLRIGNFRDLEIGRSLLIGSSGFGIVLGQDETKAHRAFETEIPEVLIPYVERYLTTYRPILLRKAELAHQFLWANDCGRRYSYGNLGARISRLTKAMLGVAISPHLFRDAAATTVARDRPAQARAIAGILGHSSLRTAERHYNQAKCLDASRSYTALIEADLADSNRLAQNYRHVRNEDRR